MHLDALFGCLNVFLSRLPAPHDARCQGRLQDAVRGLSRLLAGGGVDERIGEKVEASCLGILELCWCKLGMS